MSSTLIYLAKLSLICSVLIMTYHLFFRKLSFHAFNRFFLLLIIPLSLLLPLLNFSLPTPLPYRLFEKPSIPALTIAENFVAVSKASNRNFGLWLEALYYLGLFISLLSFSLNLRKLLLKLRSSTKSYAEGYPLLIGDVEQPFACFHWIVIPMEREVKHRGTILQHEAAHLRLYHSYDLLITELFIALNWFNPLVYYYRRLLKSVHEFQADKEVLKGNIKNLITSQ